MCTNTSDLLCGSHQACTEHLPGSPPYFLRQGLSLSLELADRLAGWQAQEILLSPLTQHYWTLFSWGCWGLSSYFDDRGITSEPFSQPRPFLFLLQLCLSLLLASAFSLAFCPVFRYADEILAPALHECLTLGRPSRRMDASWLHLITGNSERLEKAQRPNSLHPASSAW